jgi:threonine dehydrogenase-like Zn-dependent dehydrogenase
MTLPDRASLARYGGAMANYSEPVDPTTDEDADHRNQYATDCAMMTQTATRGVRSFLGTTGGATAIADPSSGLVHYALWGNSASVKPIGTYVQTGVYEQAWPAIVTDELGTDHTLTIGRAWAQVESSDGTLRVANAKVMSAQRVRIYTYEANASGQLMPSQLSGEVVTVFIV